jgi:hypothetical protein
MFNQQPFRLAPKLPASAMRTFQVSSPVATHYRRATCDESGCLAYRHGWATMCDERTTLGQGQAHYIRKDSGRRFTEARTELGITRFTFEPGQPCFGAAEHRVPLDRPEFYIVREGDWRGNPRGVEPRVHASADDWVDEFANHQDKLARAIEQG